MEDSLFYNCKIDIRKGLVDTKRRKQHPGSKNKHTGYLSVMLKPKEEKAFVPVYMHRLIWEQANQCRVPAGFQVHHIDANKENNSIFNLSLVTQRLNNWFAAQTRDYKKVYESRKRNGFKAKVTAICLDDGSEQNFDSMRQAAKAFDRNVSTVSAICNNLRYCTTITFKRKQYKFQRLKKCPA